MAQRDKIVISLIWVQIDLTNSTRANNLIAAAETKMLPGTTVSVNRNIAGTQALVKITCTETELRASISATIQAAIIRVFTEADHDEAYALVSAEAWTGPHIGPA
jgi:hypothetical protein